MIVKSSRNSRACFLARRTVPRLERLGREVNRSERIRRARLVHRSHHQLKMNRWKDRQVKKAIVIESEVQLGVLRHLDLEVSEEILLITPQTSNSSQHSCRFLI